MNQRLRSKEIYIALGVALLLAISYLAGTFAGLENFFEDILVSQKPASDKIIIVAIDDASVATIGQWPWPRAKLAELVTTVDNARPLSVGLDVIPREPSRLGVADDAVLRKALAGLKTHLVLPAEANPLYLTNPPHGDKPLLPLSKFFGKGLDRVELGQVNLVADRDNKIRRLPRTIQFDVGVQYESFASRTATLSGLNIPILSRPIIDRIVYAGPNGTIQNVPAGKVLNKDVATLKLLEGKMVFIGATASDLHDEKPTPADRGSQMSGVEIQAQIANMFLQGYSLTALATFPMIFLIFLTALIGALVFLISKSSTRALVYNIILGVIYTVLIIIAFDSGVAINFIHLHLAWIVSTAGIFCYRYFIADKEKRQLRSTFSKYVSKDVLEDLLANPEKVKLGGDEKDATIFFSDVRGFTTLSETMTPTQLTQFLNKYLTVMTDIVLERRGVIDKYIGDAIMGFWGAPLDNPEHAFVAVETALAMTEALAQFNLESKARGELEIDIGIGLNSGKVTAGNMGSTQRFDYTVMGDTVNLASRLEGQTKTYGIHILISEATFKSAQPEKLEQAGILVRELDRIKVKGKKLPVTVFQVVDRALAPSVRKVLEDFNRAREQYYAGSWDGCIESCKKILAEYNDKATHLYLDRAEYFLEHPPENWEGVYELKTK
ncbi:MAG: adenylate/guanylate cyclase domain-containing protein [Candidatus Paceibacterota bacterium]|jgi:adenylate cyclase